jgi:phosphopantothenoylcysteine synthetase/decarboxylase
MMRYSGSSDRIASSKGTYPHYRRENRRIFRPHPCYHEQQFRKNGGVALATAAVRLGAEVTLIYGKGLQFPPSRLKLLRAETSDSMFEAVKNELFKKRYDVFIGAAAVGDWKPEEMADTKISTHLQERLSIELVPTPKIIDIGKGHRPR